ncbi:hypothetical protein DOTSEDRAFT_138064 [Dothistroma septosporum NZE10]|uniref:SAGA complex subunit Spt7 n=1 Tax=Dothistroma septosporum (strain NZE10 / CBS 128990) TaxID=675120 RepID=N1PFB6_DOTSN|nr:hypothetical protein DOTSEDRAFT_138064 [Dothistroma septosporum NZE10]
MAQWERTQASIAALFGADTQTPCASRKSIDVTAAAPAESDPPHGHVSAKTSAPPKKAARLIDDDYGDDDDEDEEAEAEKESPLKAKGKAALANGLSTHHVRTSALPVKPPTLRVTNTTATHASDPSKSAEDVRKQLEEDKKREAERAKFNFQSMFYTFENDRDAMLEQQKLDELDREVENEMSGGSNAAANNTTSAPGTTTVPGATQGSLGSADLGASSLTLKHLIARIDAKRDMVKASDNQLRTLISEVRKGRSKWASEDRVGQEELYEAAEKVLMELKAMTEYAQPFLTRVSKREAPDYFNVIKTPMDIGSMIKKLKQLAYKSKKDFVDDLQLIWANCLKYNQDPAHPLRKKALYMRKETDKLIPLIPEIVVRDRAEVEAEERRMHAAEEDSDDDEEPIMASRGRKAPKKSATTSARKAPSGAPPVAVDETSTPAPEDRKPLLHASASNLRSDFLRADSETHDMSSAGFNTPPPGLATPLGVNGINGSAVPASQTDVMEVDGLGHSVASAPTEDPDEDDTEFKTWKQVTKKDRAQAAAERNRLFRGEQINPDEPALSRSKAGMRRWIRQQKMLSEKPSIEGDAQEGADDDNTEQSSKGETLAEGIEQDEDSTLPDYYNPLSAIPDLDERWRWSTDSDGYVQQAEEWMRMYPKDRYKSTPGLLTKKLEANIRQMQETRKVTAKIGIVKQMQIQAQTYQNQFQKYEPEPFVEQDVGATVVSEEGPLLSAWVNRAAFQRSIGKIFYHAGFEDFQPSALEAMTDVAINHINHLTQTLKVYHEQPQKDAEMAGHTVEEQILHSMHESGTDIESIESYIKDDVERQATKLTTMHERMKSHLADLLRPALGDHAGADGAGAFNDGSDQFVGGDFAEDLNEDFFGFRELGLADEFGLENLSVPLHLLQNRLHSGYQTQNQGPVPSSGFIFEPPSMYEPISKDSLGNQVGLIQDFFRNKLRHNRDEPLVEDEDLPAKQRFPKPRLPPTGKISSPRKRPLKEQQQAAKKKRKLEESEGKAKALKPLQLKPPEPESQENEDPEKGLETHGAPPSPESIND